ncbi:class I SAM-dependent methyltransferase [Thermoflavifilum thermophilum]|uniref:Methyltransferase domain-containing protein n=1 Tax=Thermoflavifilum thermophilum TaxID=1393122 RepID=A0A1I7NKG8_9BACT|nr:class I SAM-dependent methyltransferase [Thermoflavifilum thermophilum]SFV35172.1 Methyltransferase domain-containing protein [Thermoflavifilum thermophilum]
MGLQQFWDERYSQPEYAYGKEPNSFFREQIDLLQPGRLLMPAEGEGRNAVYAARKGWQVDAFDISEKGREKALRLAQEAAVYIHYQVGDLDTLHFPEANYDAIGLIFAHFPASRRSAYHRHLVRLLKPGGTIILEGFSKAHRAYQQKHPGVGGPQDEKVLFSLEEIAEDFQGLQFKRLEECEVHLQEGLYHVGLGKVIRMVASKPLL